MSGRRGLSAEQIPQAGSNLTSSLDQVTANQPRISIHENPRSGLLRGNKLGLTFYVDHNFFPVEGAAEREELFEAHLSGWIDISITSTLNFEAELTPDPEKRRLILEQTSHCFMSKGPFMPEDSRREDSVAPNDADYQEFLRVYRVIFPDGDPEDRSTKRAIGKRRDAMHISNARRYGALYFVTSDRTDLLRKADKIADAFDGLRAMSPTEALAFVKRMRERHDIRHGHQPGTS